jgi:hypothetical protein
MDLDFISFLKTLKPEDWVKRVTDRWTVKDVVAHMVGWEKDDVEVIKSTWESKEEPWFYKTDNYDEFNRKHVEFYKDYTPSQLIEEWEKWQRKVKEEVDRIGEDKLRTRPDLFGWLFEGNNTYIPNEGGSHYNHHYNQIKKALNFVDSHRPKN